jgi:hypothetical protein
MRAVCYTGRELNAARTAGLEAPNGSIAIDSPWRKGEKCVVYDQVRLASIHEAVQCLLFQVNDAFCFRPNTRISAAIFDRRGNPWGSPDAVNALMSMAYGLTMLEAKVPPGLGPEECCFTVNDYHRITAVRYFGVSYHHVTDDMRLTAKVLKFGAVGGAVPGAEILDALTPTARKELLRDNVAN